MTHTKTLILVGVALTAATSQASFTLFTFADPSQTAAKPLFKADLASANKSLTAGWGVLGFEPSQSLSLIRRTDNSAYSVTFDLVGSASNGGLTITGSGPVLTVGGGSLLFRDAANPASIVAKLDFSGGSLLNLNAAGGGLFTADITGFSGSAMPAGVSPTSFGFAFTNWNGDSNMPSYTSSFTSSAVPEPATLGALAVGLAALARRRRK